MINPILEFLEETYGFAPPAYIYAPITEARAWWSGMWGPFHLSLERHAGHAPYRREMYKMGMAKKICEDWATVLCNDRTAVTTGDAAMDAVLLGDRRGYGGYLTHGNFRGRLHAFVEQVFALGMGAAVIHPTGAQYTEDGVLVSADGMETDFLPADQVFPMQVSDGGVTSCAFLGQRCGGTDEDCAYIVSVHLAQDGGWRIENHAFDADLNPTALPEGMRQRFVSGTKLFAILTPNTQPTDALAASWGMGAPVFACAYDNLKGVDLAYNNFCRDLYLGGKKVFMNRELIGEDAMGNRVAPDDVAQQLFMTVGDGDLSADTMIVEHNPALRADENCRALQAQLDYLSFKVGFGTRHYRFADDRVVTATQYAGERQEMFRNASRHYLHMEAFWRELIGMAWYLAYPLGAASFGGGVPDAPRDITVDFDDSFFIDPAAERERDLAEVRAGIMAPWEYRIRHYGDSEEHARTVVSALTASM